MAYTDPSAATRHRLRAWRDAGLLYAPLVFGDETELQLLKEPGRAA